MSGVDVTLYAVDTIQQLVEGVNEIAYGEDGAKIIRGDRDYLDATFNAWNGVV